MQEQLDSVLTPLMTDERKEVILDCVLSFEEIDYGAALDELQQVIAIADDMADMSMLLARIDDIIRIGHESILMAHDIKIADEATQAQRQAIVKTILSLQYYILPDQIQLLLQGNFDCEEILAHLVPMFENVSFDEILPLVIEVSPTFIKALVGLIDKELQVRGHVDEYLAPVSRIRLLNQLVTRVGRHHFSMMLELSESGMRVGHDWIELLNNSLEALDSKNAQEAAYEMVGLAFFSNTPLPQLYQTVKLSLDEYTDNAMERNIMENVIRDIEKVMGSLNETA